MADQKILDGKSGRVANAQRSSGGGFRLFALFVGLLMIASVVGGYFYFNRAPPKFNLVVGSGPFNSDSYQLMAEVTDVVSRHSDWLSIEVRQTRDSSQNISLLNTRDVDAATIRSDTPVINDVRMIANLFPDYFQIITRSDRAIFQVTDLIGKRIAIPRFGTDEFRSFWIIGDHYDLPIGKVKWLAMDFEDATNKLLAGEVDAVFTVRSLRDRVLLNLFEDAALKKQQLRFLQIDQAEAIAIKRPFLKTGRVPKGAFLGQGPTPRGNTITATVDRVLVTREDLDPEVIRELTRILFEHRLDLTIRFALASAIQRPDFNAGLGIPLHEGSEQFFTRDEPSFIQENAEPLALMVTVFAMLVSSLLALRSRLVSGQKDRMDTYNYALLDIAELARNTNERQEIERLKTELFAILEKAVIALDVDEVTDKGFQSFSLLWESVREVVHERLDELPAKSSQK